MDLETNQIFISRNVIFHEDIFPYAKGKDNVYFDIFLDISASEEQNESSAGGFEIPLKIQDPPVDNVSPAINGSTSAATTEKTKRIPKLPSHLITNAISVRQPLIFRILCLHMFLITTSLRSISLTYVRLLSIQSLLHSLKLNVLMSGYKP